MKLSDRWEPDAALERIGLEGQDLGSHQAFWDHSADVDAIRAIADRDSDESFESSGITDAEAIRPYLPADGAFLEIGCGIGRVLQHVAPLCREVHGVDISSEMVKRAERRLRHLPNVHVRHGNGYDLEPFGDASFDAVYCGFVFQHMPKTTAFNYLLEAWRVLKPDGVFRFQVPNLLRSEQFHSFSWFARPYFAHHPYPMHFYTPVEVTQLATRAGFWVEGLTDEIVVLARKREQPGVTPGIAGGERLSLLEGDGLFGLRDADRRLREEQRRLQEENRQLSARLERILRHPLVRVGLRVRRGLRRLGGAAPR
jgi:ubiquinone/menaquinone biosynthesis C-methylase UbiE